jgi:hypothetical protein
VAAVDEVELAVLAPNSSNEAHAMKRLLLLVYGWRTPGVAVSVTPGSSLELLSE